MGYQYPVTLDPGIAVPKHDVQRGRVDAIGDNWLSIDPGNGPWTFEELPVEVVTRELVDLDTSSPTAVIDFMNNFGVIGEHFPGHVVERPEDIGEEWGAIHWSHPQLWLMRIRQAALTVLAFIDDEYAGEVWYEGKFSKTSRAAVERDAWALLASTLSSGLLAFRWRVEPPAGAIPGLPHLRRVQLHHGLCAQLHNLMLEATDMHVCANESCHFRFFKQRGGAAAGQYRKVGVKFCSTRCAQAQKAREWRKRNRNNKELG